jgi:hypothetical protein
MGSSHIHSEKGILYYKVDCLPKKTFLQAILHEKKKPEPIYIIPFDWRNAESNGFDKIQWFEKLVYGGNQFANIDKARLIKTL